MFLHAIILFREVVSILITVFHHIQFDIIYVLQQGSFLKVMKYKF
jgi:hypothetical protein